MFLGVAADEAEIFEPLQGIVTVRGVGLHHIVDRLVGCRSLFGDETEDGLLGRRQHLEIDREEVADHAVGTDLPAGFIEISGLEESFADELDQVGMVVAATADLIRFLVGNFQGARLARPLLSDQRQPLACGEAADIERWAEPVQER